MTTATSVRDTFGLESAGWEAWARRFFVRGFFAALQGLGHNITGLWEGPGTFFSEGIVTYVTQDGQQVSLPYLGIMEFDGDLIENYRAYVDPAPLIAALYPAQS